MPHRIASAKIPEALLEAVDARRRGLTRNAYMRRALEAATDGTLELQSDDARTRDLFRAGLRASGRPLGSAGQPARFRAAHDGQHRTMGVELFGIVLLIGLAAGAFLFVTGAFGARASKPGSEGKDRPKHAYVEDEANERIVGGVETADRVRTEAESDPDTEVRN